jgi:hypothetical protein
MHVSFDVLDRPTGVGESRVQHLHRPLHRLSVLVIHSTDTPLMYVLL